MTERRAFRFSYNSCQGQQKEIPLRTGDTIFLLGANGTGKSALIHSLFTQNKGAAKRLSAHRQTWFTSNTLEFTPAARMQVANTMASRDSDITARWKDDIGAQRSQAVVFDLVNAEKLRAREITKAVDQNDITRAKEYARTHVPIMDVLNELLRTSNIPITISVENDDSVVARKNHGEPYSIAELSDGERNAMLLASQVLTAQRDTLFVIDEPERHLHRSIISPLLSSLFRKRQDCAFVIATHDIGLPLDNPESKALLLRACTWTGRNVSGWDADLISPGDEVDSRIRRDILGSRRSLLFVEGTRNSLDYHIYQILFPDLSVVPQGSCTGVERAVQGIAAIKSFHWTRAFGLIDADDRQPDDLERLKTLNIYALPCYSVESLYYNANMIRHIARRRVDLLGGDEDAMVTKAHEAAIEAVRSHRERMCARVCEKRIRMKVEPPDWKAILEKDDFTLSIDVKAELENEKGNFDSCVAAQEVDQIIGRYPVRETPVLKQVATALGFQTCGEYEDAVIQLLVTDNKIRTQTRESVGELSTAVQVQDREGVAVAAAAPADAS